ncbi:hypothetical protein SDC9_94686 [bioreactor metagenome]|uniref:Uncharacterized protein n=1 Tax=bioreactor metagenome TaxID=1076179 RepID=A0A645A456_9ZZZZ
MRRRLGFSGIAGPGSAHVAAIDGEVFRGRRKPRFAQLHVDHVPDLGKAGITQYLLESALMIVGDDAQRLARIQRRGARGQRRRHRQTVGFEAGQMAVLLPAPPEDEAAAACRRQREFGVLMGIEFEQGAPLQSEAAAVARHAVGHIFLPQRTDGDRRIGGMAEVGPVGGEETDRPTGFKPQFFIHLAAFRRGVELEGPEPAIVIDDMLDHPCGDAAMAEFGFYDHQIDEHQPGRFVGDHACRTGDFAVGDGENRAHGRRFGQQPAFGRSVVPADRIGEGAQQRRFLRTYFPDRDHWFTVTEPDFRSVHKVPSPA